MTSEKSYICQYCGLNTEPLAYHEGPADCQKATKQLVEGLKDLLAKTTAFVSCWEFDPWDLSVDGEDLYAALARRVGYVKKEYTGDHE